MDESGEQVPESLADALPWNATSVSTSGPSLPHLALVAYAELSCGSVQPYL
jgi:hypothetical protein